MSECISSPLLYCCSFWYRRTPYESGMMGLVNNGNCVLSPSFSLISNRGNNCGQLLTEGGAFSKDTKEVRHTPKECCFWKSYCGVSLHGNGIQLIAPNYLPHENIQHFSGSLIIPSYALRSPLGALTKACKIWNVRYKPLTHGIVEKTSCGMDPLL